MSEDGCGSVEQLLFDDGYCEMSSPLLKEECYWMELLSADESCEEKVLLLLKAVYVEIKYRYWRMKS